jgi:hypothetical protein
MDRTHRDARISRTLSNANGAGTPGATMAQVLQSGGGGLGPHPVATASPEVAKVIQTARAAVAGGADIEAVKRELHAAGFDPELLDS